jgi:1D-myo-inositol-tetrakisphosphate 5-kinase/inositol-polyphosphate multikinase
MSSASPIPATHVLKSQVGGHANGVLTTEDDMLLIKPTLPLELQFYQTVATTVEPELDALRPFLPKFLGTLTLEGEVDTDKPPSETSINVKPLDGPRKDEWRRRGL